VTQSLAHVAAVMRPYKWEVASLLAALPPAQALVDAPSRLRRYPKNCNRIVLCARNTQAVQQRDIKAVYWSLSRPLQEVLLCRTKIKSELKHSIQSFRGASRFIALIALTSDKDALRFAIATPATHSVAAVELSILYLCVVVLYEQHLPICRF